MSGANVPVGLPSPCEGGFSRTLHGERSCCHRGGHIPCPPGGTLAELQKTVRKPASVACAAPGAKVTEVFSLFPSRGSCPCEGAQSQAVRSI